ncbi:MAG TPA: tetratricopeptide repeat protein [Candidatus Didemnitutus sp.]|nr:tetratricopeptide repeat protein [Candidatus Didemnitutus sp.]
MAASPLSLSRRLLFSAIVIVGVPLLVLGGLELALRWAGYGYSPHFFRREKLANGETVWRENRWCTAPFFSAALARRPQPVRLPEKKAPGTYRIFVLGSSAAMGDPEASFSFARVLEAMLRTAYPERRFEVVNAAITAINSNLVRGIAEDCAKLEPDLFIVYEGHNEVIGPFGPVGVLAPFLRSDAAVRAAIWIKGTRTGQLLGNLARPKGAPADWGGMEMFLKQQVTADDPRLDAVRTHFRANLTAIVAAAHRAGAVTLLCTPLTNQRDFAPFLSVHRAGLTVADEEKLSDQFRAAEDATRAGNLAAAETAYRAAQAIDDHYAEIPFRLGRLALQTGHDDEARTLLARALELDALRFRTDASLQQVIREVGADAGADVQLVDLAKQVATRSQHGVPGDEFLYEHVHLTFRGAYEVASELFQSVSTDLVRRRMVNTVAAAPFSVDEARVRLGYSAYEQAMITQEMLSRFHKPPFTGQSDNPLRIKNWERRATLASELLARPDATPALAEAAKRAIELAPGDWILPRNAGAMLVSRGAPADALPLLQRAATWIDDDVDTLVALALAHRALGHQAEADATLAKIRQLEPNHPALRTAAAK